jgi:hypothetical protein
VTDGRCKGKVDLVIFTFLLNFADDVDLDSVHNLLMELFT